MKNFDWSKVTEKQLRDVPKSTLGGFSLNLDDVPVFMSAGNIPVAELWWMSPIVCAPAQLMSAGNIPVAELWGNGWFISGSQSWDAVRRAVACIDRIANYLTIHGGDS